jgi:hypothetical protein
MMIALGASRFTELSSLSCFRLAFLAVKRAKG